MSIEVLTGDLLGSKCQTLVNTVNCVGVMGKGVALEFRKHFPEMYKDYVQRCERGEVRLGRPYLYKSVIPPWVVNFPTKRHWRGLSELASIVEGLKYLEAHYREWGITSLAVPPLGCGQGKLEWTAVGPTLYQHLTRLDIPVEMFAPFGTPANEMTPEFLSRAAASPLVLASSPQSGGLSPGLVALVEILSRIEAEPYHWPVGRVMFQKLAYFVTAEGLATGLSFDRSSFGPFAPGLKAKVTKLLNNGLISEAQTGRMFQVKVGPTYHDVQRRFSEVLSRSHGTIDRIADLFLRMNTNQAELAATVHFAAAELAQSLDRKPAEREVLDAVMEWKQRRRPPLERTAVAETIRDLASLGWLAVTGSSDLPLGQVVEALEP